MLTTRRILPYGFLAPKVGKTLHGIAPLGVHLGGLLRPSEDELVRADRNILVVDGPGFLSDLDALNKFVTLEAFGRFFFG
jgi:hypothetical protein